jgi:asparagine synthase (glutamine-hydrolysing)
MCGINGIISNTSSLLSLKERLIQANDLIYHRGPDDTGLFAAETNNYSIVMGMRRLSIIDILGGSQPIYSSSGDIVIVFNGEIYNYLELRLELVQLGHSFATQGDTEVVLKIYEIFGIVGFVKLDGMFAFSIYDRRINKVILGRDFFGEKPLYYTHNNKSISWGSELKSIIQMCETSFNLSSKGLMLYFQLNYIPAPYTIYEGIYKLEPGHILFIDCTSCDVTTEEIWKASMESDNTKSISSFDDAKAKVKELVFESVRSRAISDVPIGSFLSGGVDSSIISLCLAKQSKEPIKTFTIGFAKSSFDESAKAKVVSDLIKSEHHEWIIDFDDIKGSLDLVLNNFDEPFADMSALPTFLVSKLASNEVKVVLTGDGGDELFAGYNKYYAGKISRIYNSVFPQFSRQILMLIVDYITKQKNDERGLRFKFRKVLNAISNGGDYFYQIISLGFQIRDLNMYVKHFSQNFSVEEIMNLKVKMESVHDFREIDRHVTLEGGLLVKLDRVSMLNSLECRAPFLNKELWNFSDTLPENYLLKGWNKKYLLKEAFKEYFPKDFLEQPKQGFTVPIGDWLRTSLKAELLSYIESHELEKQNIFHAINIQRLVLDHINSKEDNTFKVWNFYCFQKWYYHFYHI